MQVNEVFHKHPYLLKRLTIPQYPAGAHAVCRNITAI